MRTLIYCLVMGLLIFFSAPAQQAATQENAGTSEGHPDSVGYSHSEDGRLTGPALTSPRQSITGIIVGLGLIGFVLMNAKRREPVWCRSTSFWAQ